jgi:hypothetical protein
VSDTFSRIEVITGVARQRRFLAGLKQAVVAETMQPGYQSAMLLAAAGWRRAYSSAGDG